MSYKPGKGMECVWTVVTALGLGPYPWPWIKLEKLTVRAYGPVEAESVASREVLKGKSKEWRVINALAIDCELVKED